jgi:hypothetical protein
VTGFIVVTEGDRKLCIECWEEAFDEQDPATYIHSGGYSGGVCEDCGAVFHADWCAKAAVRIVRDWPLSLEQVKKIITEELEPKKKN